MVKIIFLDIDGVFNCEEHYRKFNPETYSHPKSEFCPDRINILKDILEKTGAKIVVSSSWRFDGTEKMKELFGSLGVNPDLIIDITPNLDFKYRWAVRGNEIEEWIIANEEMVGYKGDFKHYAIIDDDGDMLYPQRNNFFQTTHYSGLTQEIADKIIEKLNS